MLHQPTLDKLTQMKLLGFVEELRRQEDQSAHYAEMSFEERLGYLVEEEWLARESRRLSQRLRRAKLKQPASLEDLDYSAPRGLDRTAMRELARCGWLRDKQNILVTGPTGVGKTYVACALANQACREGYTALYTRLPRLLADIDLARTDGSYPNLMRRIGKASLLVIDDWGLAPLGDQERRDVLEVLEERYDCGSVVITSQLPVSTWHGLMGDATLADAILDRLVHNAHRIAFKEKAESMRKTKNGLKKKAQTK